MKILLWLDDVRDPMGFNDVGDSWLIFSPIENPYEVVWVKDYHEFVKWIETNGLPDGICFDHDLGYEYHYTNTDLEKNDGYVINYDDYKKELSGYHCAKWLVDYCLDNNCKLPAYNIQSQNTVGKDNIDGLFKSYIKHCEKVK